MKLPFFHSIKHSRNLTIISCLIISSITVLTNCDTITNSTTEDIAETDSCLFLCPDAWKVPHDVSSDNPSQRELAIFAWKEFIALNWPSNYNTTSYTRGKPDTSMNVNDFLNAGQFPDRPLVWQTYKHRVEIYPEDTTTFNSNFNTPPQYHYSIEGQDAIYNLDNPTAPPLRDVTTVFNNLDETSEIDLCTVFISADPNAPGAEQYPNPSVNSFLPGAPRRVIYEAKANEIYFDYVVQRKLYNTVNRNNLLDYTQRAIGNDNLGGLYPCGNDSIICFPHGVAGGSEGSIEVKASWRQLTREEYASGRYITAPVIYYRQGLPGEVGNNDFYYKQVASDTTGNNIPIGLVGLHIIHKTANIPTYVFATFEQVDNLNREQANNDITYYNRNDNTIVNPNKQDVVNRPHPILEQTKAINTLAQNEFREADPNSVWQYYKLIGIQGPATNNQDTTDFFLANIVTETNEVLRSFSGTLDNDNGTIDPRAVNVRKGRKLFISGGCKGCHGNAQKGDFSFISVNAPFDGTPDAVNQALLKSDQEN